MEKLRECPFCEGEAEICRDKSVNCAEYSWCSWYAACQKGCCQTKYYATKKEVTEAWNHRPEGEGLGIEWPEETVITGSMSGAERFIAKLKNQMLAKCKEAVGKAKRKE